MKKTMTYMGLFGLGAGLMFLLMSPKMSTAVNKDAQPSVATKRAQAQNAVQKPVTADADDGSVIVKDSGASFEFAPASPDQPRFVSETESLAKQTANSKKQ